MNCDDQHSKIQVYVDLFIIPSPSCMIFFEKGDKAKKALLLYAKNLSSRFPRINSDAV